MNYFRQTFWHLPIVPTTRSNNNFYFNQHVAACHFVTSQFNPLNVNSFDPRYMNSYHCRPNSIFETSEMNNFRHHPYRNMSVMTPYQYNKQPTPSAGETQSVADLSTFRPNNFYKADGKDSLYDVLKQKTDKFPKVDRKWQNTEFGGQYIEQDGDFVFTVMTYNVLAQNLLSTNSHLYSHCLDSILSWEHRSSAILHEITGYQPQILCLQEVKEDHFESFFKPKLELLGYCGLYKKRTGDKSDGCALFYAKAAFNLLQVVNIEFRKSHVQLMDRDNVAIVALLQPVSSIDCKVCVATTHLLFNPKRSDIRFAQMATLLAEIEKLSCEVVGQYHPIILCGDFNFEPYSQLYKFLIDNTLYSKMNPSVIYNTPSSSPHQERFVHPNQLPLSAMGISNKCAFISDNSQNKNKSYERGDVKISERSDLSHCFNLASVYNHYMRNRKSDKPRYVAEISTQHKLACTTVDYLFYSVNNKKVKHDNRGRSKVSISESSLRLLSRLSLFCQDDISEINGLPNHYHGSDHMSLAAKFVFQAPLSH
ncbi:Protein angel 2 [Nymphon striatum]|nr:Protein angel 2 [Nymphon striatum]